MIRLSDRPKEPFWLDLPDGVRIKVRALNTIVLEAAKRKAARMVRELAEGVALVEEFGGEAVGLEDLADPELREGATYLLLVESLMLAGGVKWEGVATEGGPAELSRVNVRRLLLARSDIADAFWTTYLASEREVASEGEGSAPSPNGSMARAPNTAEDAEMKASHVPAESGVRTATSARSSRTSRAH